MIPTDTAEAALVGVRELVAADGGDIQVVATTADSVSLLLVLDTAECAECVMPRSFLETVALDMMRPAVPELNEVTIIDPREEDSA